MLLELSFIFIFAIDFILFDALKIHFPLRLW